MLGHPYTNRRARSPRITPLNSVTLCRVCTGWPRVGKPSYESGHRSILPLCAGSRSKRGLHQLEAVRAAGGIFRFEIGITRPRRPRRYAARYATKPPCCPLGNRP